MQRTNAVRLLEKAGIEITLHEYEVREDALDAVSVAVQVGVEPERVFKTLVARTDGGEPVVFCIPGSAELDLRKAAVAVGSRSVALIRLKELLPLTGYLHGGCSPVGMKRAFRTWIDETAELFDSILISAGVRGVQVEIDPAALRREIGAELADVTA